MSRTALAPGHARQYETVYVLRPNTDRETAESIATRAVDAIRTTDGILEDAELWGQRRLAYPIKRHHRGIYVYLKYLAKGAAVAELERQLRLADGVIRFQTVQLRNNVLVEGTVAKDKLDLDFDVRHEPDEPEVTRERELGLDAPPLERRRRRPDDEDAFDDEDGGDGDGGGATDDAEEDA